MSTRENMGYHTRAAGAEDDSTIKKITINNTQNVSQSTDNVAAKSKRLTLNTETTFGSKQARLLRTGSLQVITLFGEGTRILHSKQPISSLLESGVLFV
jgi:hypothetical protein